MKAQTVVLLGEALMVFNGPADAPIDRGSLLSATFAGAESNVAIGLARLGHSPRWLSVLGDDEFGRIILRHLRGEGVDVSRVPVRADAPTATMFKSHRAGAEWEVWYYRRGSAMSLATSATFGPSDFAGAAVLYLSGITPALGAGCRELTLAALRHAREHGAAVWFDANHRRKLWSDEQARSTMLDLMPHVDVALVGLHEGRLLSGSDDPQSIARALLDRGAKRIVVKAGAAGAWCVGDGEDVHAPAIAIDLMVDPIGAGDGFAAGFLSAHLEGLGPRQCLERGHAIGAMVCQTRGDWEGLPTRAQLDTFVSGRKESNR